MGIGAEEIDVGFFHIDGKRSESLDGIEGEENSPIMKQLADRLDVDPVAVEEVGAGEGDELGFGGEGGGDQLSVATGTSRSAVDQTNSMRAIGALSPWRGPSLRMRV